jgi:hypothetical protein
MMKPPEQIGNGDNYPSFVVLPDDAINASWYAL